MHGVNYWPSWGSTPVDHWTAECRADVLERELGYAVELGFDSVRLWMSAWGYEQDPPLYVRNLLGALDRCEQLGLAADVVLFDSCGVDPELGEPQGPALIWEGWVPNPGYYHLGDDEWPRWESFARAVVEAVRDHPACVLLEVMNEPFVTHVGMTPVDLTPIRTFYTKVHCLLVDIAPDVPLTIGADTVERFQEHESDLDAPLDIVSFHPLTQDTGELETLLDKSRRYADETGRTALASEWGVFPGVVDDGKQLERYEANLPVVLASGCAWMITHLMGGRGPFATTAIARRSGAMRPAAKFIRRTLTA